MLAAPVSSPAAMMAKSTRSATSSGRVKLPVTIWLAAWLATFCGVAPLSQCGLKVVDRPARADVQERYFADRGRRPAALQRGDTGHRAGHLRANHENAHRGRCDRGVTESATSVRPAMG